MKTLKTILFSIICLTVAKLSAQDGYTYTLVDNGGYSFTIAAVPNPSSSNFATSVQSYGFTIIVPDGVTASITSSLGSGAGATPFDGGAVGQPSIDGYLITETLGSPISLPAPSAGTNSPMVTIQINGAPTSGTMRILANDDPLAVAVPPLQSFLTADMTDDGSATFTNTVTGPSGVSGDSSFDFDTLSIDDVATALANFSVYPNPVKANDATVNFHWNNNAAQLNSIALVNINGVVVKTYENMETITGVNTLTLPKMNTGVYFMQFAYGKDQKLTKKLIIN